MVALPDRRFMTVDEYLAWEPAQEDRYEYWDGEVVMMSGGTKKHNRISFNCSKLLDDLLIDQDCEVYISDVKVQVDKNHKFFYPDVVVTCDDRDQDEQFIQYPTLIIEVLSPSTEAVDRGAKFAQYRKFETLKEYLLVQVQQPLVEMFQRNEGGQWFLSDYRLDEMIPLESLGCSLAVKDIYEKIAFELLQ